MKQKGCTTYLNFVCIDKLEVNISRIANQVVFEEHDVPKGKVIQKKSHRLELLHRVLPLCYRAYLFDNSGKKHQYECRTISRWFRNQDHTYPTMFYPICVA